MEIKEIIEVEKRYRRPSFIVLAVLTFIVFMITIIFNTLTNVTYSDDLGIFKNDPDTLRERYRLDITPANWMYYIWAFIYPIQLIWLLYAHTLICRENKAKTGLLYYDPPILPPSFLGVYLISLLLNITWLFCYDSEYLSASFVALAGISFCLHVCLAFSFRYLWDYENELTKTEMWLNIILVQNGLGIYSGWISIISLIEFGTVLRYDADVSMDASCAAALAILAVIYLTWAFIDIFIATTRLRYYFMPYIVLIITMSSIVDKNWDSSSGIQIFVVVLLALAIFGLVAKIVACVYRIKRKPLEIERKCEA